MTRAGPVHQGGGQEPERRPGQPADRVGQGGTASPDPVEPGVAVVAREQLVPAVAGQGHGDLGAGQPADQVHGDLRDVTERLVPDVRELGDDVAGVAVADLEGGVIGPEVGGDGGGLGRLVEGSVLEPHREGPHRSGAVPLHQRHHHAGVDASGEEGTDGNVSHHPSRHRVGQHGLESVGQMLRSIAQRAIASLLHRLPG